MEQEGWTTPHAYGDTTTFGGFLYGNLIATEDDEMSQYIEAELDEKVIPLVQFFNANGLPTLMSCQLLRRPILLRLCVVISIGSACSVHVVALLNGYTPLIIQSMSAGAILLQLWRLRTQTYTSGCTMLENGKV